MTAGNIVLADPSFIVRAGFRSLIEKDTSFNIAAEAGNSASLWQNLEKIQPDILITDYDNNSILGIDDFQRISRVSGNTRVLVFSDHQQKENILKVIKSGVTGYLTKKCSREEIISAVEAAWRKEKFFCSRILDLLIDAKRETAEEVENSSLSQREVEILQLIARGYSNKEISDRLFLSIHTVYTHRKNIMKKLNFKSPVELVLYALNSVIITE